MKHATVRWAIAGLLVSLCTLFVLIYGTTHGPTLLVENSVILDAADQVMSCAASGDYSTLEPLLYGAPTLGDAPEADNSAQGLIWKAYLDSIQYSFPETPYAVDSKIALDVCVTCLDISAITDSLHDIAPKLMADKAAQITEVAVVYDEDNNYQEAFLAEVMAESAAQALESSSITMEQTMTLQFVRSNGTWQLLPSDEFLQFLSGFLS